MRDYLLTFLILVNVPIGIVQPYYGLLVYCWVSYMYPHLLTWSFARTLPVAKLSAASALIGTLLVRTRDTAPLRQRESVAMALLWLTFTISTFFAFYPAEAW